MGPTIATQKRPTTPVKKDKRKQEAHRVNKGPSHLKRKQEAHRVLKKGPSHIKRKQEAHRVVNYRTFLFICPNTLN